MPTLQHAAESMSDRQYVQGACTQAYSNSRTLDRIIKYYVADEPSLADNSMRMSATAARAGGLWRSLAIALCREFTQKLIDY